jgi:hypothetical protein
MKTSDTRREDRKDTQCKYSLFPEEPEDRGSGCSYRRVTYYSYGPAMTQLVDSRKFTALDETICECSCLTKHCAMKVYGGVEV